MVGECTCEDAGRRLVSLLAMRCIAQKSIILTVDHSMFSILVVPEAAPTDVLGKALSSTSLSVSWRQIEPQQINGVNQGYRVEIWDHLSTLGK